MHRYFIVLFVLFVASNICLGQLTVSSIVYYSDYKPASDVTIDYYFNDTLYYSTVTDENGYFILDNKVKERKYVIKCTTKEGNVYWENNSLPRKSVLQKPTMILLPFEEAVLTETFASDIYIKDKRKIDEGVSLDRNQYKIMPASFQDPMRILLRFAGFTTSNDGANGIIYRGFAPENYSWQLNGLDIVNPNHLGNAGTGNDFAVSNAGGTLALPSSILGQYTFHSAPSTIATHSSIAGISSLQTVNEIKSYVDLNLLGFEGGTRIRQNSNNHYITFRTSFTGFLSRIGVDFGGEKISFIDLNIKSEIYKSEKATLTGFVNTSGSSNDLQNGSKYIVGDSLRDVYYNNVFNIWGAEYKLTGNNTVFSYAAGYSNRRDIRNENPLRISFLPFFRFFYENEIRTENSVFSNHIKFSKEKNDHKFTVGARINYSENTIKYNKVLLIDTINEQIEYAKRQSGKQTSTLIYPYFEYGNKVSVGTDLQYKAGVSLPIRFNTAVGLTKTLIHPELFGKITYQIRENIALDAMYRLISANNIASMLIDTLSFQRKLTTTHSVQLALLANVNNTGVVKASTFGYKTKGVSIYQLIGRLDLSLNTWNGGTGGYDFLPQYESFTHEGYGDAYVLGGDIFWEQTLLDNQSLHFITNYTYFTNKSRKNTNDDYQNGKYSFGQSFNISVDKKIRWATDVKTKELFIGIGYHFRGGFLTQPYRDAVNQNSNEVYQVNAEYNSQLNDYHRVDARIVLHIKNGNKIYNSRWSLDIQNIFSIANDGYAYYDQILNRITIKKQLGIIPLLGYRVEF